MKKLTFFTLITSGLFIFGIGCSSASEHSASSGISAPPGSYSDLLEKWTGNEKEYSNGEESFDVGATLLAPEIVEYQVYKDSQNLNWTQDQFKTAHDKALYDAETQTTFFVSFYTDQDSQNDLDKSSSIWNVFLDVNGRRLTPSNVKRDYENKANLKDKYPYMSVWARSYLMTFAVPVRDVLASQPSLNISSVMGSAHLKFPKE